MPPRDRDARLAATIARGCGFERAVAVLVVRQLPPVTALLARDDATVRHVLADQRTRQPLTTAVHDGFKEGWHRATMERLRRDHADWLRDWWLPACPDAELSRLRGAAAPRPEHHRIGLDRGVLTISAAAAEMLVEEARRREVAGSLVVDHRVASVLRDLALAEGGDVTSASRDIDEPPAGIDPDAVPATGWWHG